MTSDTAVDALRRNRAETSNAKQNAVLTAVDQLAAEGGDMNVSAVAKAAGVSRQFIYTHRSLQEAITNAEKATREAQPVPSAGRDMTLGLRADRRVLSAKIERQAATITELNDRLAALETQRQRWLGSQLGDGTAIDPEIHAELRITNERLVADNLALTKQVAELRRINTILEADLAASRQAHAEDLANRSADTDDRVTVLAARR